MKNYRKLAIGVLLFSYVISIASNKDNMLLVPVSDNQTSHDQTRLFYKQTNLADDIIELTKEDFNEFRYNPHAYAACFSGISSVAGIVKCVSDKIIGINDLSQISLNCISSLIGFNRQIQSCKRQKRINNFIKETVKTEHDVPGLCKKIVEKIKDEYGSKSRKQKLIEACPVLISGLSLIISFIDPNENPRIDALNTVMNGISAGLFCAGSIKDLICELCCKKEGFELFEEELQDLLNQYKQKV